jgi:hypothetical protein
MPENAAEFFPLDADPLVGEWSGATLTAATVQLPAFSQAILIDIDACPNCISLVGDYDGSGVVNNLDHDAWRAAYGNTNSLADGNGDGVVDAADFVMWRRAAGQAANASLVLSIPEPAGLVLGGTLSVPGVLFWHRLLMQRERLSSSSPSK